MPPKINPLKLNPLQLKTLTLLQELARDPESAEKDAASSDITFLRIPHPHGDHFHLGTKVVLARDATGLHNPAVYVALERKGLTRGAYPLSLALTAAGQNYETGLASSILHGADH